MSVKLTKLLAEIPAVEPRGRNPHHNSVYITLPDLMAAVKPVLDRHGVALTQIFERTAGEILMRTRLITDDGSIIFESVLPIAGDRPGIQALGAAITYSRRYAIVSMLGVAEPDSDGELPAAAKTPKGAPPPPPRTRNSEPPVATSGWDPQNKAHVDALREELTARGVPRDRWQEVAKSMRGKGYDALDQVLQTLAPTS